MKELASKFVNSVKQTTGKEYLLSIQHLFAMFGATVLVPLLTGLNPSMALVAAGLGTLVFHLVTKGKVPVFLGSSFAFIGATAAAVADYGIPYAQGGILAAGAIYLVLSLLAYVIGPDKIKKLFPPVVTGPVIVVIGMSLAGVAIQDASGYNITGSSASVSWLNWLIAFFVLIVVAVCNVFSKKGIFKIIPILIGMASGYILCAILDLIGVFDMSYAAFETNKWFNVPYVTEGFFSLPVFKWSVILSIAPIAFVTFMEHVGDITTNGAVVGKDFFKDPGLHRTLLGDGLATMVAGLFGGPANTTYSENTGVLAATKNYNPKVLRMAAVWAIVLGFFGKFGAILQTIPVPVKGGVELVLFGMISAIGIRTLAESDTDMGNFRNVLVVAVILVFGIGITASGVAVKIGDVSFSGLFLATLLGILLNVILPAAPGKSAVKAAAEHAKAEEPAAKI